MPNMLFANNANTTLASSITSSATSISVTSSTGFPSPTGSQYFYCTLADAATQTTIEIVKVTAVSGTTWTVVRGQDGTTGTAFAAGDVVSLRLVRASLNDFPKLDETNTFTQTQTFNQTILGSINGNAGTATNLAGGSSYAIPYQTGSNATSFLAAGTSGSLLMTLGSATAPIWVLASTLSVSSATTAGNVTGTVAVANGGTGLTSLTAGYIPFGNGTSAFGSSSNLFWDNTNYRLGIGTASPGCVVDIVAASNTSLAATLRVNSNNVAVNTILAYDGLVGSGTMTVKAGSSSPLILGANNTETVRLFSSGGVSIGNTTDPGAGSLSVSGSYLLLGTTSSAAFQNVNYQLFRPGSGDSIFGHISGTASGSGYITFAYAGTSIGSITQSGTTGVLYNITSDRRLKSNIAPLTDSGTIIDSLLPRTFTWNADGSQSKGFITDEYQQVFPNAVTGQPDAVDEKGNPIYQQGDFSTSEFMAVLVAEIQSIRSRLKAANIA